LGGYVLGKVTGGVWAMAALEKLNRLGTERLEGREIAGLGYRGVF
jgi:hypothetical protein